RPEVYIVPRDNAEMDTVEAAVRRKLAAVQGSYPGVDVERSGGELRLVIPQALRTGHEAHFAAVTRQFLGYIAEPATLPTREMANLLAKYHLTTHGVQLARLRS